MKKTIASRSGGIHIELSDEEAASVRARWALSEKEQADAEAARAKKESNLRSGLNKIAALLTATEKDALMEKLGLQ